MKIYKITDTAFQKYGKVISGIDVSGILKAMEMAPCPEDVVYVASDPKLEAAEGSELIEKSLFGGMPAQIGYCNGHNKKLNALEYHRSSESHIMATDAVFMLGLEQDIEEEGIYDTSKVEVFFAPKGSVIEVYATTLHYAPCNPGPEGFKVVVALPKGTNLELQEQTGRRFEDRLLFAVNKWLVGHPEGGLPENAFIGLYGRNLSLDDNSGCR